MTKARRQFDRAGFLKAYSKWIDDQEIREVRLLEPTSELEGILTSERLSYEQRISVSTKMRWPAGYFSATGTVTCFSDPASGWRLMRRARLYSYWSERIVCRARDFWRKPRESLDNAFNVAVDAAISLAIARPEADWYLDLLNRSLTDGCLAWCGDEFFAAYLVRLYRRLKHEEDVDEIPPQPEKWEHPFGDVIDSWDDEERLADAMRRMCDYHLRWNKQDSADHRAEFSSPIAILNPVEIHALEAVRSELGLSTPRVEHELLQPPFYPIPESAKNISAEEIYAEDPLLARIVELNQPWCDGLEDEPESPRMEDAVIASEPPEEPATPSGNQVYQSDGITITSVSGDLTEETISVGKGLAHVLSFAPLIENHVAAGRIEEAIRLFQKVSGASREEAEASIMREKNRHEEG